MKRLLKKIEVGDLVRINSDCENTRKPIYKVYGIIKTQKGIGYILEGYAGLHRHIFKKEELILV